MKKHDTNSVKISFDLLSKHLQIATTMAARTEGGLPVLWDALLVRKFDSDIILGDPGADKGGEGKSKRAEKYIWNEER